MATVINEPNTYNADKYIYIVLHTSFLLLLRRGGGDMMAFFANDVWDIEVNTASDIFVSEGCIAELKMPLIPVCVHPVESCDTQPPVEGEESFFSLLSVTYEPFSYTVRSMPNQVDRKLTHDLSDSQSEACNHRSRSFRTAIFLFKRDRY